jgi:hypothetical protein
MTGLLAALHGRPVGDGLRCQRTTGIEIVPVVEYWPQRLGGRTHQGFAPDNVLIDEEALESSVQLLAVLASK